MKILLFSALIAVTPYAWAAGEHQHHPVAKEASFGRAADPRKAKRTIKVEMNDQMRFIPAQITVKRGEVVRFVPTNKGKVLHEMVLGTMEDLKQHAAMMKEHPDMEHDEHEPNAAEVRPGKSGQIGWQFTRAGEFYYGCLVPGHFEAGMVGKVIVTE
ncbi:MAG TPA: cupredoxin family protein [Burkholderiales bacterium]